MNTKMSISEKRSLLDSAGGKFFSVEFVKKDGNIRKMTCKRSIDSYFTYGKENAKANPHADNPDLYTVAEMNVEGWRTVNLKTLKFVKINGKDYTFDN